MIAKILMYGASLLATRAASSCTKDQANGWDSSNKDLKAPSWPAECEVISIFNRQTTLAQLAEHVGVSISQLLEWNCFLNTDPGLAILHDEVCVKAVGDEATSGETSVSASSTGSTTDRGPIPVMPFPPGTSTSGLAERSEESAEVAASSEDARLCLPFNTDVCVSRAPGVTPITSEETLSTSSTSSTSSSTSSTTSTISSTTAATTSTTSSTPAPSISTVTVVVTPSTSILIVVITPPTSFLTMVTSITSTSSESSLATETSPVSISDPLQPPPNSTYCNVYDSSAADCRKVLDCDASLRLYPTCIDSHCECAAVSCTHRAECIPLRQCRHDYEVAVCNPGPNFYPGEPTTCQCLTTDNLCLLADTNPHKACQAQMQCTEAGFSVYPEFPQCVTEDAGVFYGTGKCVCRQVECVWSPNTGRNRAVCRDLVDCGTEGETMPTCMRDSSGDDDEFPSKGYCNCP